MCDCVRVCNYVAHSLFDFKSRVVSFPESNAKLFIFRLKPLVIPVFVCRRLLMFANMCMPALVFSLSHATTFIAKTMVLLSIVIVACVPGFAFFKLFFGGFCVDSLFFRKFFNIVCKFLIFH